MRYKIMGSALAAGAFFSCVMGWLWFEGKRLEHPPIRIGTNPWPGYEYLYLAERKGFFKEENANIQLVRFSSLEDVRRAYENHYVDGLATTIVEVLQAHEHGAPAKIVIIADFSNGADVIVARKEIEKIADLKGKKIGVEPATMSAFILAQALNKEGLSLDDVRTEGLNPLNMEASLLSGEVDAVHTYPPVSLAILSHADKFVQIFDSSQIPKEVIDIVSVHPEIIANRPEDIKGLQRAFDKAQAYAVAHPDDAYQIMAGYENITVAEFAKSMKYIKILRFAEQEALMRSHELKKTISQVAEVLRKEGELQEITNPQEFLMDMKEQQ